MTASLTGQKGEAEAAQYLVNLGYKILTKNFHSRFGEIDIICQKGNALVFVEVKTRSSSVFGAPIESVTASKLSKMIATAQIYMSRDPKLSKDFSFDVVEVFEKEGQYAVQHTKNITL